MSDENFAIDDTLDADSAETIGDTRRRRGISERLAKLLMLIAIGIVAVLLSITISFLTYRYMDRGNRSRQFPVLSENYMTEVPDYFTWDFLTGEGYDLRAQTADVEQYTVSAKIKLGYDSERYRDLSTELTTKNDALMDTIRFYFSTRTREQLNDEVAVKNELMSKINSLLSRGEVEQILFLQYQIIGI